MILRTFILLLPIMAAMSNASVEQDIYVVHMDKNKIKALDASLQPLRKWYDEVLDFIAPSSGPGEQETSFPQLLYVYDTALSGFAAKLSIEHLQLLKGVDGFLSATRDEMLSIQTTHSPHFLGLKSGRGLWSSRNLASDVIVGVLDTGIWPEHVSFNDLGMSPVPSRWKGACEAGTKFSASNCNKKLIGARIFYKGYEAIAGKINETSDYKSPRDSEGHGTHTASTAAGNLVPGASFLGLAKGSAAGMMHTARIAAYKVCYSSGCASSDILAAIDQAVNDGVDVLSLSLGGFPRPYYSDNIAIASFGAIRKGVFVACSAGNSGPINSSVGNAAPWIMTVAASYTDRSFPTTVKLNNGQTFKGGSLYYGKPTKQLPLVYGKTAGGQGAEFCSPGSLSRTLIKGKIVLCDRGINSRTEKGEQVKMAGGAGMLLINNESEGEELLADPHILPATSLEVVAGTAIKKFRNSSENARVSIKFEGEVYGDPAPVMAAFSSRGPSLAGPDIIKPDVTAPGVNILAAWPPNITPTQLKSDKRSVQFNIVSGTSMSCPHISGLAALIKAAHKDWSPAAIKSALMTTAYTLNNRKSPIADAAYGNSEPAKLFTFGSGHIDPEKASDPGLIYDISPEDYTSYLCSLNYNSTQISLFSGGNFSCPDGAFLQPGDLNYPSFSVLLNANARNISVTYRRTVTNVGNSKSSYSVDVTQPDGISILVDPEVLKFKKIGEKLSYKVTFIALSKRKTSDVYSFGSLVWRFRKYVVRSPIAVTWQ